jgi:hypothetical protein
MKRLLEVQPDGITEVFHFDEATGRIAIEHIQDTAPVIEANKRAANDRDGFSPSRELREVAEIPMVIALKWKHELGVDVFNRDHWPAVKRLLRDPEWRFLRTSPGRI